MRSFRVELGSDNVAVIVHAGDVGEWTGGLADLRSSLSSHRRPVGGRAKVGSAPWRLSVSRCLSPLLVPGRPACLDIRNTHECQTPRSVDELAFYHSCHRLAVRYVPQVKLRAIVWTLPTVLLIAASAIACSQPAEPIATADERNQAQADCEKLGIEYYANVLEGVQVKSVYIHDIQIEDLANGGVSVRGWTKTIDYHQKDRSFFCVVKKVDGEFQPAELK